MDAPMKYYREKVLDLWHCFAEGRRYSLDAFRSDGYLRRLVAQDTRETRKDELERVAMLVRPTAGLRVLDFGCGLGSLSELLAARGCSVTGADASPEILAAARSRNPALSFVSVDEAPRDQDVVTSMHVLGHVPDPRETLRKMYDLLAPGGRIVFCVPNPAFTVAMIPNNLLNSYLPDTTVMRCWSSARLRSELRQAGFTGIRIATCGEFPGLLRFRSLRSRLVGEARR